MSLFDHLVDEALKNNQHLSPLRNVVEKELLHHDVLRILSQRGLLKRLTFIGGTCLRACYGSSRLSEDLDFTGGADFKRDDLSSMGTALKETLQEKYGLSVEVSDPLYDDGKVKTWKMKIQTRPERPKDMPAQRIHIDVCAIPSYHVQPMLLLNPYHVDMGTSGLIIQAESREEIFVDKLLAFALRSNRIKNRDLWDIVWLHQNHIKPRFDLIEYKLKDHCCEKDIFLNLLKERVEAVKNDPKTALEFKHEMYRFLPHESVKQIVENELFWIVITNLMEDMRKTITHTLCISTP